jgi:selenocysteine lyase/cysteine desulfurase
VSFYGIPASLHGAKPSSVWPSSALPLLNMELCGHALKKACFYLDSDLLNLNHGSFGTVPKEVMQAQHEYHIKQESCPELWFREWYALDINAGRKSLANLINSEAEDIVFVENASYAVNSIVSSMDFKVGFSMPAISTAEN